MSKLSFAKLNQVVKVTSGGSFMQPMIQEDEMSNYLPNRTIELVDVLFRNDNGKLKVISGDPEEDMKEIFVAVSVKPLQDNYGKAYYLVNTSDFRQVYVIDGMTNHDSIKEGDFSVHPAIGASELIRDLEYWIPLLINEKVIVCKDEKKEDKSDLTLFAVDEALKSTYIAALKSVF